MNDPATLWSSPTAVKVARNQQLVKFGLNYRFSWENPAAITAPEILPDVTGEIGARIRVSTGRFQKSLYSNVNPAQLNSRLTYSNLNALALECVRRWDHTSGFFLKTTFGGTDIAGGHLNDEDFPPAATTYSNTLSIQKTGRNLYGWGDLGYSFLRATGWKIGAFAGYQYYGQRVDADGCSQLALYLACVPLGSIPYGQLTDTQHEQWQGLRVGLSGDVMLTDNLKLYGEAAYLPWLNYQGSNNHWLRPPINPFTESGTGSGVQIEGILIYKITHNLSVGFGVRYMWLSTDSGACIRSNRYPPP